ncbi:MAG: cation:proton antiporter [Erysipelotrichales bacterium]|nr:cation:proton antiporter [Erysipelotrichales bacterium]
MEFNILFYVGLLLCFGIIGALVIRKVKLPAVTGYLIAGLLIGPHLSGIIPESAVESLSFLSSVALGFIAFSIGAEFKMSYFKRVGLTPIVIAILEALCAVFFVIIALLLAGFDAPFSIMLGAIAAATAPAATIMVIKQYKAKGPVTETLLSVVAIDDAVALIGFALATAVAQSITTGGQGNIIASLVDPILEIVMSLGLGAILGMLFIVPFRVVKGRSNRLTYTIAFVLLGVGLAATLGISELLLCMAFGAVFTNFYNKSEEIMQIADEFTPPLLMIFFVLSGAELNLAIIPQIGLVGIIYVVVRVIGKVAGAAAGAKIMKASDPVVRWLGPALIPQAGVAIGLSLAAERIVPGTGSTIRAVVLCATLIYELVGPAITKWSLTKAGEIKTQG